MPDLFDIRLKFIYEVWLIRKGEFPSELRNHKSRGELYVFQVRQLILIDRMKSSLTRSGHPDESLIEQYRFFSKNYFFDGTFVCDLCESSIFIGASNVLVHSITSPHIAHSNLAFY